ncbi:TetR/AcrR family transcriptional regulator [Saccharothrix sp.]|uniref:TetR/AcrR family transcriptional regulator n=1 Tax=Saccharothrix sp. TaxID=1873460 RepID=UPI0028111253|nr:TetR/AcrR family transcriptional regulator [Saccharothrix sp.]
MTAESTAARLALAAARILREEGAQAVTMRRVAAEAGVTAMATYRHFPNREALLRTVVDQAVAEVTADWGKRRARTFRSRIDFLTDEFLDFALGERNLYAFVMAERWEGARRLDDFADSPAFRPVFEAVRQGIEDGVLRTGDPLEITLAVTTPVLGLVQLYHGGRIELSEKDFRGLCKRTVGRVLDGVAA